MSEKPELLIKIHGILNNAMYKLVDNTSCILAHIFNSASRQH